MENFPTTIEGLSEATRPLVADLQDGDAFDLEIAPVRKAIGDATGPAPGSQRRPRPRTRFDERLPEPRRLIDLGTLGGRVSSASALNGQAQVLRG
jgi:hypothetical protein